MLWKSGELGQVFSVRLAKLQYNYFSWQLRSINNGITVSQEDSAKSLNLLDKMMQLAITEKDDEIAYQTVEIMKKFFGEQKISAECSGVLLRLCSMALLAKRHKTAAILLDTYKPLIRQLDAVDCTKLLDEFVILIDLAKKSGQNYLLDKIARSVFYSSSKAAAIGYNEAVRAIKDIGLNAIKSGDVFLLKSAAAAIKFLPSAKSQPQNDSVILLLQVWLHQILKRDDLAAFQVYRAMVYSLNDTDKLSDEFLAAIIAESNNAAAMVGANIHMRCRDEFVSFLVEMSQNSVNLTRRTAYCIGQMAKMSIALHGLSAGFTVLMPLLEKGRKFLQGELRFMNSLDSLRKQLLFAIIRENILLIENIAKQMGGLNELDIIMELQHFWQKKYLRDGNRRLVEQFCQLLLRQMLKDRQRLVKRLNEPSSKLLAKPLFDISQTKKLGFTAS